jgi:hypothetical protein
MAETTGRGRLLPLFLALSVLALLLVAWRGQHAFQYADER